MGLGARPGLGAGYGLTLLAAVLLSGLVADAGGLQAQETVSRGSGALLRGLDKITGTLRDLDIPSGKARRFGSIIVSVEDCRYPTGNPAGNAFAHVSVWAQDGSGPPLFSGWMVAGSPALNALDHPRYDVWVLSCTGLPGAGTAKSD